MNRIQTLLGRYRTFIIYSLIGASGATLDFVVFSFLSNHIFYVYANAISVSLGICNNFIWNYFLNFKVRTRFWLRFLSFYSVGIIGLATSSLLLWIFISKLAINPLISKFITIFVIVILQFSLNALITFRKGSK